MVRAKKVDTVQVWWVDHPDHHIAIVSAPNWEQATVEAAKWWDVPWREVAAMCECVKVEKIVRNICVDCGTIFHGEGPLCAKCAVAKRDRELNRKARERRFYREMMPVKRST